ncbi:hypothetical protein M433DRAFT_419095 [Acidomyces richmondensis BFW]|nr:MAG: hypothetical protein FE78DRAFT_227937 [Acidomyces sp. 'richmondensis']KYG42322.1 hypothetical protein M433DRAFT_419095 [Acidomyces richmondensis BFW]
MRVESGMNEIPTVPTENAEHQEHAPLAHLPHERRFTAGSTTQIQVPSLAGDESTATGPEGLGALHPIMRSMQDHAQLGSSKIQLGSLHQRSASGSLEKLETRQVELLPLCLKRTEAETGVPTAKSMRLEDKVQTGYDDSISSGFPSTIPTCSLLSVEVIVTPYLPDSTRSFNVFTGLWRNKGEHLLRFSYFLLPLLMILYFINQTWNTHFNRQFTAFVFVNTRKWTIAANPIHLWRCCQSFCIKDPCPQQTSSIRGKEVVKEPNDPRDMLSMNHLLISVWYPLIGKGMLVEFATKSLPSLSETFDLVICTGFIVDFLLNAYHFALYRSHAILTTQRNVFTASSSPKLKMAVNNPTDAMYHSDLAAKDAIPRKLERKRITSCGLCEVFMGERINNCFWPVLRDYALDSEDPQSSIDRRLWIRLSVHSIA